MGKIAAEFATMGAISMALGLILMVGRITVRPISDGLTLVAAGLVIFGLAVKFG